MASPNEIKKGIVLLHNGEPWVVTEFQHINPGKGAAFVRTRIKNAKTGRTLEQTYKVSETIEIVEVDYRNAQYLNHDATGYTFMDMGTYDQYTMSDDEVGDQGKYLREGLDVTLTMFEGNPIALQFPRKMNFRIAETTPAVKGDTATGNVTKEAKTDGGFVVRVPIFINEGEEVVVNTDTGEYVERAKKE
ncbi:elongation factor P [Patescibacteria group bacterium]|nr:elongation factor P [Patescibacteria group bacterium]MBU1448457.1 elongation factor P [Patescibacteria group bacterium]MBU2613283.1 elongation factor P [Patescibacteria group bacterium]